MASAPAEPVPATGAPAGFAPAGFWVRYAAWSLDAACLLPFVALLSASRLGYAFADARTALQGLLLEIPRLLDATLGAPQAPAALAQQLLADPAVAVATGRLEAALGGMLSTPLLVYVLLALPYSVLCEQSRRQATPGKRAFGLLVADAQGKRLKGGHALLRFFAAGLSWLLLNIGHALALLPPQHLALHDRLSDTRVLRRTAAPRLPGWAKAWLVLQLLAGFAAAVALFLWLQAAMQAAMQQALGGL